MKSLIHIGRFGGLSVSIHWTFLLLFIWIVLVNFLAGFRLEGIIWSLLLLFLLLLSILAHEAGHGLVARYFRIKASGVILLPIGGVASIPNLPRKRGQEMLITLAGPAVSLLIAGILLLFVHPYNAYWSDPENIGVVDGGNFLFQLQVINLSLGLFNLIPAFPMDGGRLLRGGLGMFMNIIKATTIAGYISKAIACLFIGWGLVSVNLIMLMTGLFILFASQSEEYYLQLKTMAHGLKLRDVLMHDYDSIDAAATVMKVSDTLMNNHSRNFIVMENGEAVGTVNRMQIVKSIAEMKYQIKIRQLMTENLDFLAANTLVENLIEKLAGKEEKLYPVMDHGHFAGVVNFQHIIEYLLIHSAATKEYSRIKSLAGIV